MTGQTDEGSVSGTEAAGAGPEGRSRSWPTAATGAAGVIGFPVRHSLSPVLHNAAFAALRLDWAYLAFEVPPGEAAAAVGGARALGLRGLSVTMPHKEAVIAALDRLSPVAARLQAVNTVVFADGLVVGENTDGIGFLEGLRREEGIDVAGMRCLVVGAGGAARAVVLALDSAGAASIAVINRTRARAEATADLARPGVGRVAGDAAEIEEADLVVNATPIGMETNAVATDADLPLDPVHLRPGQVVVDLVYHPRRTALLDAAELSGARAVGGLPMLLHQAAAQFELWTNEKAPLAEMRAAAESALAPGGHSSRAPDE
jgi:shikimate dehydrogenase